MQIMQSQTPRTQLPTSNVVGIQQGLSSEQWRVSNKNEHLPTHDFHISQSVMYLNPVILACMLETTTFSVYM